MNFKFSPSENEFEYREYINYRVGSAVVNKIYMSCCVKLLGYILVFINVFKLFNKYKFASNITTAILLLFLGITVIVILICLLGKKIGMKYKKQFVDIDTIYSFKVDENKICRENKYSYIEAPLKSITEIIKIHSGLIIKLRDIKEDIFIPSKSLPIEVKEFIHYIEGKNSELEVNEYRGSSKNNFLRLSLGIYGLLIIAIILGLIL